jgi:hypothetical protein
MHDARRLRSLALTTVLMHCIDEGNILCHLDEDGACMTSPLRR